MKRFLVLFVVGGLLGMLAGAWVGPKLILWWFAPPVQNNLLSCNREIGWAMDSLVKAQLGASLAGALLVAVAGTFVARARKARSANKPEGAGTSPQV